VELCGGLDGGGLTPSFGTLAVLRDRLTIPLYVLIRPRVGDFVFDAAEVEAMRRDVEQCVRLGCDGVVLGALDPAGEVDMATMRVLIAAPAHMKRCLSRQSPRHSIDPCAISAAAKNTAQTQLALTRA
jgi:copper homeostasis protein CutC